MSPRRLLLAAGIAAGCGVILIALGRSLPAESGSTAALAQSGQATVERDPAHSVLAFTRTPRHPGNLLARRDVVGRSAEGKPIGLIQRGDPAIDGEVLVFGCIHGDECAASEVQALANGCPDPRSDVYVVPNLNPDGFALGTRLNGRSVDLNRNFPASWRPIGERGDPQYSGPRPFSEPETRLAGTAPNWQNHRFPGTASFVVELPRGPLADTARWHLGRSIVRLARQAGEDGDVPGKR